MKTTRMFGAAAAAALTLFVGEASAAVLTFGGAGNQQGNDVTLSGGNVFWAATDSAVGDGRYGSYNGALTTPNFNQTTGGINGEARGIVVNGGSVYVGGSSRPPALTVDNAGGWENKPFLQSAPSTGGAAVTKQITTPPSTDRVFAYNGTEWVGAVANSGSTIYVTGGGEAWGQYSHYAAYLSRVDPGMNIAQF